jgi:large subunit ribosomal protein L1
MPNPKTGTVTMDVAKAVADIKGGKIEFRVDRQSNLHFVIGKASFSETQLVENYATALEEILRSKPSAAKGRYIKKIAVSTTMGPGILVDPGRTRDLGADSDGEVAPAAAPEPAPATPDEPADATETADAQASDETPEASAPETGADSAE